MWERGRAPGSALWFIRSTSIYGVPWPWGLVLSKKFLLLWAYVLVEGWGIGKWVKRAPCNGRCGESDQQRGRAVGDRARWAILGECSGETSPKRTMSRDHGNTCSKIVLRKGNDWKTKVLRWEWAWGFEDEPTGQCGCHWEDSGRSWPSWPSNHGLWEGYGQAFLRRPIFLHFSNPK